jgi:hypothetical protein
MMKSFFLLFGVCFFCQIAGQQKTVSTNKTTVFPYRGWSIAVDAKQLDVEETYAKAVFDRAAEYKINTLEFHDFVMEGGIVESLIQYDSLTKVNDIERFQYKEGLVSRADKNEYLHRFHKMLLPAKNKNVKINVWYHALRDIPDEVIKQYPEISDLQSGFLWKYIEMSLSEFFIRFPEVDRLTLISLHETPSILQNVGNLSREEVLLKLYLTIYNTCKKFGKELIIRDFIISQADFDTFWDILDKLPKDIYIMTKSVLADWAHIDMPNNSAMHRYKGRKLIVEFDLYGEWSGRGNFPVCYPDDIIRHLREAKALAASGAIGRLIHDHRSKKELPFNTIFESPLDINCYVFSRYLSEPIEWLGESTVKWHEDIDAVDKKYWMQWAVSKYGEQSAVGVVRALERTAEINKLTFNIAGKSFRYYVWYPTLFREHPKGSNKIADTWHTFSEQATGVGIAYLKDEKRRALQLATASLIDIKQLKGKLSADKRAHLEKLFEEMILIIRSYQLAINGYSTLFNMYNNSNLPERTKAANALNTLANEIDRLKGKGWYFDIAATMRILSKEIVVGKLPL